MLKIHIFGYSNIPDNIIQSPLLENKLNLNICILFYQLLKGIYITAFFKTSQNRTEVRFISLSLIGCPISKYLFDNILLTHIKVINIIILEGSDLWFLGFMNKFNIVWSDIFHVVYYYLTLFDIIPKTIVKKCISK